MPGCAGGGDGDGGRFDIVIGNPPYVQYKRIRPPRVAGTASPPVDAAGYRAELRRRVWAADPGFWASGAAVFDGRADLCLYFHFLGFSRLRPGGVLALLTAESWLDVDGGHAWQAYMLARGVGRRLVGHGRRQSFAGADVDTLLLFLRRPADVDVDAAAGPCREPVLFMQIDGDYAAALSPSRWRAPLAAGGGGAGSAGGWVWKTVAVDELWNEGGLAAAAKSGGPSDEALNSVIPDDGFFCERPRGSAQPGLFADNSLRERGPYRGGKWGGRHLRNLLPESGENAATPDLPTTTDPRLCALAELARIVTGIKEGGYKRYLRPRPRAGGNTAAAADDASPPPELAGGVLKDPRRHSRPGLDAPDADLVAAEAGAKVLAKAARGGAPLLWLAGRGATHKAWWNPAGHPFTGNFLGLWPEPSVDALPLLAALNSLWTAWRSEAAARGKGIGGAACVFTAGDLRAVAVPDLRTLSPDDRRVWSGWGREMLSWPFEPLLTRAEAFAGPGGAADSSPWTRFDLFVFDFLGLAAPAGRAIAADLRARLLRRRGKANAT